jgi:hypothetical protein
MALWSLVSFFVFLITTDRKGFSVSEQVVEGELELKEWANGLSLEILEMFIKLTKEKIASLT